MIFEPSYNPQAVLRNRESLPEEKAMAEAAQHLRREVDSIRQQMNTLITADVVEFLKTPRPAESREQQIRRVELFEEGFRGRWRTSGCDYAACFARHDVRTANQEDFAEAWEQAFRVKRDETIRVVLNELLAGSRTMRNPQGRALEEYEKARAVDRIADNSEPAILSRKLAESKGFFSGCWAQENMKRIDIQRWISSAYEMAPAAEKQQHDLVTKDFIPGRLRTYQDVKVCVNIASFAATIALFAAHQSQAAICFSVLPVNFLVQAWLSMRYNNKVDACLNVPRDELRADRSLSGALMWTGELFKSVRDMNPIRICSDRTDLLNSEKSHSVTRILKTLNQIGSNLHRNLEHSVDEAVERAQRGTTHGFDQAYYQSRAITCELEAVDKVIDELRTRWKRKGVLTDTIAVYSGFLSGCGLLANILG